MLKIRTSLLFALSLSLCLIIVNPIASSAATKVSIDKTIASCKASGIKPSGSPIQSKLKAETSLIGMAYLNYIYQNDLKNPHFCQSMMLMNSQVPASSTNPYTHLFDPGMGEKTIPILQDIQLSFDYSIARTNPPESTVQKSIATIQAALRK